MDFDTAKENIQPLRQGRRADRLETALQTEKEMTDALMTERRYVNSIKKFHGSKAKTLLNILDNMKKLSKAMKAPIH